MFKLSIVFYSLLTIYPIIIAQTEYAFIGPSSNKKLILGEENSRPIASITKLFTSYYILKSGYNLKQNIIIVENAKFTKLNPKAPLLQKGEKINLESAIEILLITSSNLVARSIAISLEGSENKFVNKMNAYFNSFPMNHTHFADTHGLSVNSKSSIKDIISLLYLYKKENFLMNIIRKNKSEIITQSKILYKIETTLEKNEFKEFKLFGKTGSTLAAGRCFAGFVEKNNELSLLVILNSENIYIDIEKIISEKIN